MMIKKSGKHIIGADLTNAERKALDIEIRKQIPRYIDELEENIIAIVLFVAHFNFGRGRKKCLEICKLMTENMNALKEMYQMEDYEFVCMQKLAEAGIDVRQLMQEVGDG